jgi:hypothetical protein
MKTVNLFTSLRFHVLDRHYAVNGQRTLRFLASASE